MEVHVVCFWKVFALLLLLVMVVVMVRLCLVLPFSLLAFRSLDAFRSVDASRSSDASGWLHAVRLVNALWSLSIQSELVLVFLALSSLPFVFPHQFRENRLDSLAHVHCIPFPPLVLIGHEKGR